MKHKFMEWLGRYLPAEISGTLGTITGGLVVHLFTSNTALITFGGTWGENLGYYSMIIFREMLNARSNHQWKKLRRMHIVARNIIVEFGFAEVLDSFVMRPFLLYLALRLMNNIAVGLLVGKICADLIFYCIAIIMYEYRKKYIHD